jgi:hypothetical protein
MPPRACASRIRCSLGRSPVSDSADLAGVSRYVSVPAAAILVSTLVLRGRFHRVEHVLLVLATGFAAYIAAGLLSGPDWGAAARGLVVPTVPLDRAGVLLVAATIGTTLAPWGLSFIQSYAVDKRLTTADLPYERIDVITGAVMTGVIGAFVVLACAATLHVSGTSINDAGDVRCAGRCGGRDRADPGRSARADPVPHPGSQRDPAAAAAHLLARIARDPVVMGRQRSGPAAAVAYSVTIAVVVACVAALAVLTVA